MIKKITTDKHAGYYSIRIQPMNKVTGKRESWPIQYAKTKNEAKAIERKMWADYEDGYNYGDANDVFSESFEKYVKQRHSEMSWSPVTYKAWNYSVKVFKEYFPKTKIKDIDQRTVNRFAHQYVLDHHSGISKTSVIARRLVHMRHFFNTLVGHSVSVNPVPERPLNVFFRESEFSTKRKRYLFNNEELRLIKQFIQSELVKDNITSWGTKLAIWIDLETGMRPGEIQALRFENLVINEGYPTFKIDDSWSDNSKKFSGSLKSRPHGAYRYCLPVSQELADFFDEYHQKQTKFLKNHDMTNPRNLVFLNLHDYKACSTMIPITQHSMNDMLKHICQEIGIGPDNEQLSMYSFRHTICTKLANKPGISYPWAAARMGHTLEMFMHTYVKTDRDREQQMMVTWLS